MIEAENLVVRFDGMAASAVDQVSFKIEKGESFGIVGESGCGKSTVLRVIAGLNTDYDGTIRLDGTPVSPKRSRSFFRRVQMVFQDPYGSLHPRKTILSQLMEPLKIQGLDRPRERASAILDAVGLSSRFRYRYPHQLSGGQRQRVAIARALVLEPEVLVLDEPTSALDVSVQAEILNLLADLREQRNLTYLLVSHDLSVIAHMCDRLVVMQSGRIVDRLASDQLRQGCVEHPYTHQLLTASEIYGERAEESRQGRSG
jgi:peptide/nickel transport system ATP-binding protein